MTLQIQHRFVLAKTNNIDAICLSGFVGFSKFASRSPLHGKRAEIPGVPRDQPVERRGE